MKTQSDSTQMGKYRFGQYGFLRSCHHILLLAALFQVGCAGVSTSTKPANNLDAAMQVLESAESSPQDRARAGRAYRSTLITLMPGLPESNFPPGFAAASPTPPTALNPSAFSNARVSRLRTVQFPGLHREGLGLPLIAAQSPTEPNAPQVGFRLPATLVATRSPSEPSKFLVSMLNPEKSGDLKLGNQEYPLAMDLEGPLLATRATGPAGLSGLMNLIRVDVFGESRLRTIAPVDLEKTPVVLVHGLISTPTIWADLVKKLMEDEAIRERCQFWFFYYPTGQPVPLSALQLRDALDEARKRHGLKKPFVLVGHSMGGLLSRVQITELQAEQAREILGTNVMSLPPDHRVRRSLVFKPRNDVRRAVFIATPHRGSRMADQGLAGFAKRLIRLPGSVQSEIVGVTDLVPGVGARLPTSIHGLSPRSQFLQALDNSPTQVPMHSIIGNRGRREALENSSDGVVPYSSAHLPDAKSEVIMPTGHSGFNHPKAVAEVKRLLLLN